MADSENVNTTQQVTSNAPVTSVKNLKRVAAGKAIAEKNRQAREEQKKKLAEADAIIANEQLRKAEEAARKAEEAVKAPPVEVPAAVEPVKTPAVETERKTEDALTTTQWLSVISIIISVVGIYYKREEIKKVFAQKTRPKASTPLPVDFTPHLLKPQKRVVSSRWIEFFFQLNVYLHFITMIAESMIRASAVGGITMLWSYFTLKTTRLWGDFTYKAFKICQ